MTARIALHVDGDLGRRVMRVLLAEPDVEVGLFHGDPVLDRTVSVTTVAGWDALAVGAISEASRSVVGEASSLGIPVVVGDELPTGYPAKGSTFVGGVLTGSGLAAALAMSMIEPGVRPVESRLAWTVPGHPLGAGIPVTFPDPVGPLWAGRVESPFPWPSATCLAAPDDTPWRGVEVRLKVRDDQGDHERIRGIADDGAFLDAICMAAAALAAARGAYPDGADGSDGLFMSLAGGAGLEVAAFVPAE